MGREGKGRKGEDREGERGRGGERRDPKIFYCTPSSSFLEICLPPRLRNDRYCVEWDVKL